MAGIGSGGGKAVFGRGTTTGVVVRVGVSKGATAAAAAVLAMRYAPRISGMYDGPGRRRVGGGGGRRRESAQLARWRRRRGQSLIVFPRGYKS